MRLGAILYGLWATGITGWFLYAAMVGTSPFAASSQTSRGAGIYGPNHK